MNRIMLKADSQSYACVGRESLKARLIITKITFFFLIKANVYWPDINIIEGLHIEKEFQSFITNPDTHLES